MMSCKVKVDVGTSILWTSLADVLLFQGLSSCSHPCSRRSVSSAWYKYTRLLKEMGDDTVTAVVHVTPRTHSWLIKSQRRTFLKLPSHCSLGTSHDHLNPISETWPGLHTSIYKTSTDTSPPPPRLRHHPCSQPCYLYCNSLLLRIPQMSLHKIQQKLPHTITSPTGSCLSKESSCTSNKRVQRGKKINEEDVSL